METGFKGIINWINFPILHIGDAAVTLGKVGLAICIFLGALIVSAVSQRLLRKRLYKQLKLTSAAVYSLSRIIHYSFLVLGVFLAAQCIGLNFSTLAVTFGFLGVGIGFGLQNITSNFISGIILLFERPIGVGDLIKHGDSIAEVLSINMRSTIIRTFDNVTIVVPNTKFIENDVINWSMDDPRIRLHCPIGVAYGSNVDLVNQVLLNIANEHSEVLNEPSAEVRFLEFGDSSLNFDLLIWTARPDNQKVLRSEINFMIDKAFRENGIRISFPQLDLHVQMTPAIEALSKKKEK
ncbi:MAG: mechanosensitive ion channel [Candidatus Zapsychrus exili]|nr:mechanosensitive ion channel [Candidatus Zapsychrus exili]